MQRLRKALLALQKSLGLQKPLRDRATRKMKARHAGQQKAERQAEAARVKADELRKKAHEFLAFGPNVDQPRGEALLRRAERKDRKAGRLDVKAEREKTRKVFWRGRVRVLAKRIHGIETDIAEIQMEIAALGPKVNLGESKVSGGNFAERWRLANLTAVECCANGRRRNAYSMAGSPDIWHPFGPGPAPGRRDDCSTYVTSQALATGADDPNGNEFSGEGFTGTLVGAHGRWKQVSFERMVKAGQGYIVYGGGVGHHTEAFIGGNRTVGHGSAPVDLGVPDLFGDGDLRCYVYDPD